MTENIPKIIEKVRESELDALMDAKAYEEFCAK